MIARYYVRGTPLAMSIAFEACLPLSVSLSKC
jgi:hypothetical protein